MSLNSLNSLKANGQRLKVNGSESEELSTTLNSSLSTLIILPLWFEIALWMMAGRALAWCILAHTYESAVAALPPYLAIAVEEVAVGDAREQLHISALVFYLYG